MDVKKKYYSTMSKKLLSEIRKRNMDAEYYEDSASALKAVMADIPEGSAVSWGGSVSLAQAGFHDALRNGNFNLLDRDRAETPAEADEIYRNAFNCDYYFMGTNAITVDGKLVNIDGRGNRLAALLFGPAHVIIVIGMNKVTADEKEALSRVNNVASPQNAVRLDKNTPCGKTGRCGDCLSDDSLCSNIVITRRSWTAGRIKVILIGEDLGY